MRIINLLIVLVFVLASCSKYDTTFPANIQEGVLSIGDNIVKNEKGHIPSEVLNYPDLTDDERDFIIALSNKHEVSYCLEDGKFDDFLHQIRENPDLKKVMLGNFNLKLDTVAVFKNVEERLDMLMDAREEQRFLLDSPTRTKSEMTETRRRYATTAECAGVVAGKVFGLLQARKESTTWAVLDVSSFKSVFESNANLAGAICTWVDTGSYGNIFNSSTVKCFIHGDLRIQGSVGGLTFGPTIQRITHEYVERFFPTNTGGGGDPGNGGGTDPGNDFGWHGGDGYINHNCTGASFMFPDMQTAFSCGMSSFKETGPSKPCINDDWYNGF